jgi:hypothetical protein
LPTHLARVLKNTRGELRRAIDGMSEADLERRVAGINSVAWIVGHLAGQEQGLWLQGRGLPAVADLSAFGHGAEPSTPAFGFVFPLWEEITSMGESWLDELDDDDLRQHLSGNKPFEIENVGSLLTRVIGHYYLHIGQITAIRKILGYSVPGFVGSQEGAYFD